MLYVGIDPGLSGGIAALADEKAGSGAPYPFVVMARSMPQTERDVYDLLTSINSAYHASGIKDVSARAMLEFVRSSPQMGVASAFKFGMGYGGLRMALIAASIPFDEVTPAKWQRAMGCLTKGDKNVSKRRAQELFPTVKVTHAIADALLLAEYARRAANGSGGLTKTTEF